LYLFIKFLYLFINVCIFSSFLGIKETPLVKKSTLKSKPSRTGRHQTHIEQKRAMWWWWFRCG
jgi:hypothetical protein